MNNIKTILGNEIGIINEFLNIKTNKILKEIISNDLINYYNSILNKYEEINKIGVKLYLYRLILEVLIRTLIFSIICIF